MGFVLFWLLFVALGGWVGSTKGRTGMGVILSLLLGVLGILIVALLPETEAHKRARGVA